MWLKHTSWCVPGTTQQVPPLVPSLPRDTPTYRASTDPVSASGAALAPSNGRSLLPATLETGGSVRLHKKTDIVSLFYCDKNCTTKDISVKSDVMCVFKVPHLKKSRLFMKCPDSLAHFLGKNNFLDTAFIDSRVNVHYFLFKCNPCHQQFWINLSTPCPGKSQQAGRLLWRNVIKVIMMSWWHSVWTNFHQWPHL